MLNCYTTTPRETAVPIIPVIQTEFTQWLAGQDERVYNWAHTTGFQAESAQFGLFCNGNGELESVFVGMADAEDLFVFGELSAKLPKGIYRIDTDFSSEQMELALIAWGLGHYQFTLYKPGKNCEAELEIEKLPEHIENMVASIFFVRDLINTPTEDMGPADLAEAAVSLAEEFSADISQIIGDDLLNKGFPAIHAVGRASDHAPRLIDMKWGDKKNPKLTLVGKGVCFDSGGLDLKPSSAMRLMKKDMSGAAHCLGLASMIMHAKLPVRLRVLIPAVENAVSGGAYRPGDVIATRSGLNIEIGNTDAEGRVVIADALAEASTENPDLLIDFTTLTGAASVALGEEIGVMFSNDDAIANDLLQISEKLQDPLWQLPLYQPYNKLIESKIAHLSNTASSKYGGAITAALFLQHFVAENIPWLHFDLMAWNDKAKPGKPEGGEAQTLRAVFVYLSKRFA